MSGLQEKICRLCLTMVTHEFNIIDEVTSEMFDVLLLKLNFEVSDNPIICKECFETAVKLLDFKSVCVDTEEIISSFAASRRKHKFNISDMYEDSIDVKCEISEKFICRFCMNPLNRRQFTALDSLMNMTQFKKVLEYMPEMDFNTVKNAMVCTTCLDNLQRYFEFVQNSSKVEKKINAHFQENGTNDGGYVKLSDVLCFTVKRVARCSTKSPTTSKTHHSGSFSNCTLVHKDISKIGTYDCSECTYTSKYKTNINRHMLIHKNFSEEKEISEIQTYNCSECSYKTKFKCNLRQHMLVHRDISEIQTYNCSECSYKAKLKCNLKQHMLVHRDISEIEMFKCSECTYKTKYKGHLKQHVLLHKDSSKIQTYNCSECSYKAKLKCNLKQHMLVHRDISETEMFNCSECTFKSKHKNALKRHVLVHRDISEMLL